MKKAFLLTVLLAVVGNAVLSHGESVISDSHAKREAILNQVK